MQEKIEELFIDPVRISGNFISRINAAATTEENQEQTKDIFSDKWEQVEKMADVQALYDFQFDWFLKLYGFESEAKLAEFLADKSVIVDTGCGLGYKAAWFAKLAPHAIVIGIDISEAARLAAKNFAEYTNLYFLQADITQTGLRDGAADFTVCDQVIMHTENPEKTFAHLAQVTAVGGEFACYVYRKKALPRELVDDYFRARTHEVSAENMWAFSEQLTVLGKTLSDLKVSFTCPDIPELGIKGGEYDIQRFIYWNFLKCFWKEEWSFELNRSTNYDWYAPSNAKRFSRSEFEDMATANLLITVTFHEEEACYSARFKRP